MHRRVLSMHERSDPAPRAVVLIMGADPSAIADHSASNFPLKRKYINRLCLVSFLQ
jgi:hypothetical protein